MGTWVIRYISSGFKVTALLVDVAPDGFPVYQILKVEPARAARVRRVAEAFELEAETRFK